MLNNEIRDSELFKDLYPVAEGLDMSIVDISKTVRSNSEVNISITIMLNDGITGIDDCEKFHRSVMPRLELMFGRDNLSMEVSTPGLQRLFRDVYEFSLFKGKIVRVYDLSISSWVKGTILELDSDAVILSNCLIEDGNYEEETHRIEYKNIQKAKLDYVFPSKKETK